MNPKEISVSLLDVIQESGNMEGKIEEIRMQIFGFFRENFSLKVENEALQRFERGVFHQKDREILIFMLMQKMEQDPGFGDSIQELLVLLRQQLSKKMKNPPRDAEGKTDSFLFHE